MISRTTRRLARTRPDRRPVVEAKPLASRRPGLEALRASSMLVVVALHAATAYTNHRVPGLLWVVREPSGSIAIDFFCWWALGATMPAFFALGGFAASAVFASRGLRGYLIDRLRRIVYPFLIGGTFVLLPTAFIWSYGWLISGRCSPMQFVRLIFVDPEIRANRIGPAHLWFLEYLIPMLFLFGIWRAIRGKSITLARFSMTSPWAPFLLAIPTSLVLWAGHAWSGLDIVLDLRNSFVINPFRWVHHGLFFLAGTRLHRDRESIAKLSSGIRPWITLVAAGAAFAVRALLLDGDLNHSLTATGHVLSAVFGGLTGWLGLYAALGLCGRIGLRFAPALRRFADASYWVYLIHFPIVGLVQADLYLVKIPIIAKLTISLGIGLAGSFASRWLLVRYLESRRAIAT